MQDNPRTNFPRFMPPCVQLSRALRAASACLGVFTELRSFAASQVGRLRNAGNRRRRGPLLASLDGPELPLGHRNTCEVHSPAASFCSLNLPRRPRTIDPPRATRYGLLSHTATTHLQLQFTNQPTAALASGRDYPQTLSSTFRNHTHEAPAAFSYLFTPQTLSPLATRTPAIDTTSWRRTRSPPTPPSTRITPWSTRTVHSDNVIRGCSYRQLW